MTYEQANAIIEQQGVLSIMSHEERQYIWRCVTAGHPVREVVEVGSAYGGTTALMALAGAAVTSIENWECGKEMEFRNNMRRIGVSVKEIVGDSVTVAEQIEDQSCSVVLVDGDHTGTMPYHDLCAYAPKVRTGGWLLVDDVANGHDAVLHGLLRWLATTRGTFAFDWMHGFVESCSSGHHLVKLCGFRRVR